MLNERLAGNPSYVARRYCSPFQPAHQDAQALWTECLSWDVPCRRIEWLKVRRKHWKHIYEHVTKQDAAITLAMIEEASQQVQACRTPGDHNY